MLAEAHIQIHQESPGFGAAQILCFQFHLCWPVMSQKDTDLEVPMGHITSLQELSELSTSLAHTRWVLSWIHLKSPYLDPAQKALIMTELLKLSPLPSLL